MFAHGLFEFGMEWAILVDDQVGMVEMASFDLRGGKQFETVLVFAGNEEKNEEKPRECAQKPQTTNSRNHAFLYRSGMSELYALILWD